MVWGMGASHQKRPYMDWHQKCWPFRPTTNITNNIFSGILAGKYQSLITDIWYPYIYIIHTYIHVYIYIYPWDPSMVYMLHEQGILMGSMLPYIAAPWIRHGIYIYISMYHIIFFWIDKKHQIIPKANISDRRHCVASQISRSGRKKGLQGHSPLVN